MAIYIAKGSKGELVRQIQSALSMAGFDVSIDGLFGIATEKAVMAFQKQCGLRPVDGIVGNKTWEALFRKDAASSSKLTGRKSSRDIKRIFVHCTAGNQNTETVSSLKAEFKSKGWKVGGYHYVVFPDGKVVQMEDENTVANGVKGYNSNSIHVSWVGGYKSADNRTARQKESLVKVLKELRAKYPSAKIMGHRDISPDKNGNGIVDPWERVKDCPCFEAKDEYKGI